MGQRLYREAAARLAADHHLGRARLSHLGSDPRVRSDDLSGGSTAGGRETGPSAFFRDAVRGVSGGLVRNGLATLATRSAVWDPRRKQGTRPCGHTETKGGSNGNRN